MRAILSSVLATTALAATVVAGINDNLQLYLPFSGSFEDVSAATRSVAANGNTALCPDRSGTPNSACVLDGDGDYLGVTPTVSGMRDFTVAQWLSFNQTLNPGNPILQCGNIQLAYYWFPTVPVLHEMLEVNIFANRNGLNPQYAHLVPVGDWRGGLLHVAVVAHDNNSFELYINGTLFWSGMGHYDGGVSGNYSATRVGGLPGVVDEVRIYSRALTAAEVQEVMVMPPPPPPINRDLGFYGTGEEITSSPALGLDGTVYVGSADGKFYAFAGGPSFQLRGQFNTGGPVYSSPTVGDDGTVYIATWNSQNLLAFAQGSDLSALVSSRPVGRSMWTCPTLGIDGSMYFASGNPTAHFNKLASSDPQTWNQAALSDFIDDARSGGVNSSPAAGANGLVYFAGSWSHRFVALRSSDWTMAWSYPLGIHAFSSPAIGTDGTVYVGDCYGRFYAFDGNSGTRRWQFAPAPASEGNAIYASPVVATDNTVYFASSPGTVYALNGQTGAERWRFVMGGGTSSSPLLAADGTLYIGAGDRYLYALDAATGQQKWKFKAKGPINQSAPVITPEGIIYFGTGRGDENKGWVHAVQTDGAVGLADAPWPMFKQNAQHTGRQKGLVPNHAPTISCPQATVVNCAGTAGSPVQVQATVTDPDAGTLTVTLKETVLGTPTVLSTQTTASPAANQVVTFEALLFTSGAHLLTIEVSDGAQTASCETTLTIEQDTQAPTVTPPAALTVNTDAGQCHASGMVLGSPVTDDNCRVSSVVNNAPTVFQKGATMVTWTVTDTAGNTASATQTITVNDGEKPTIAAPANVEVSTDAGTSYASGVVLGIPTTADNCGVAGVANNAPAQFPQGSTTVTWTVTDTSGNTATAMQIVTVNDTEPPTIVAPADVIVNTDPGQNGSGAGLTPPVTSDNSGIASVTSDAPATFPFGTTVVTWTVTDTSGNVSTITQTVTVRDAEKPAFTAPPQSPAPIQVAQGLCSASGVNLGTPEVRDNCGVASVVNDAPAVFPKGVTIVTWTVTDTSGNTATATQTVTVVDSEKPTITAPAAITMNADAGQSSASGVNLGTPATADNCGVATVANNAPATFPVGTTTVTWTVTDTSGNSATATQTVTVKDNQPPTLTAPPAVVVNTDLGKCEASNVALGNPTASDNCGAASVANNAPAVFERGVTVVTWTATDNAGNTATASQTVTVNDAENPTITAPAAITVNTDVGQSSASGVNLGTPATADNCGVATVANNAPATFPLGTTTVTWTVTDTSGNAVTATQTVTVEDKETPAIVCPANITLPASPDLTTPVTFAATATDNCAPAPTITCSPSSGSGFPVGVTTVTCTATDASGNTAQCFFTVTRPSLSFVGFLSPIGGADATGGGYANPVRTFKLKSTIPVKFTASCNGAPVMAGVHRLQAVKHTNETTEEEPIDVAPQGNATTGNAFRYADGQWLFNLDTQATGLSVGIWELIAILSDGSEHSVWIQLK
ncbi:MAG: HYR domain-containing protein [Verrucomicrobia bacterium]|nr:HYR domain-containing protein [Verrucomicrobiota bacterium]